MRRRETNQGPLENYGGICLRRKPAFGAGGGNSLAPRCEKWLAWYQLMQPWHLAFARRNPRSPSHRNWPHRLSRFRTRRSWRLLLGQPYLVASTRRLRPSALSPAARAQAMKVFAGLPMMFEANNGQTDPRVKFLLPRPWLHVISRR